MEVNRADRDKAIILLRQWVIGRISDDYLIDSWPKSDSALKEIFKNLIYPIADGVSWTRPKKPKLSKEARKTIARAILFLQSNQDYLWPPASKPWPLLILLGVFLAMGFTSDWTWAFLAIVPTLMILGPIARNIDKKKFKRSGEWEIWPFLQTPELQNAKSSPRYLSGGANHG
jgi:hypothetical protein